MTRRALGRRESLSRERRESVIAPENAKNPTRKNATKSSISSSVGPRLRGWRPDYVLSVITGLACAKIGVRQGPSQSSISTLDEHRLSWPPSCIRRADQYVPCRVGRCAQVASRYHRRTALPLGHSPQRAFHSESHENCRERISALISSTLFRAWSSSAAVSW